MFFRSAVNVLFTADFLSDGRNYILLFIKKGKNIVFQGVKFVRDLYTMYFYKMVKCVLLKY